MRSVPACLCLRLRTLLGICMLVLPGCSLPKAVLELPQSRTPTLLQVEWRATPSDRVEIGWSVTYGERTPFQGFGQWTEEGVLTLGPDWPRSDCARPRLFAGREELEPGGRRIAISGSSAPGRNTVLSLLQRETQDPGCAAILFADYVDGEPGSLDYRLRAWTATREPIVTLTLPREPRLHAGKGQDLLAAPALTLIELSTLGLVVIGLALGGGGA